MSRKPSAPKTCPICGKSVAARGYKNHIRLKHKLQLTEQVVNVPDKTQVKEIVESVVQRITPPVILNTGQLEVPAQEEEVAAAAEWEKWHRERDRLCSSLVNAIKKHGTGSPEHIVALDDYIAIQIAFNRLKRPAAFIASPTKR